MKYIKLYESGTLTKDFFKDKIDWKFYNYLLHQLTEYQDKGYNTNFGVFVHSDLSSKHYVCVYNEFIDFNAYVNGYNEKGMSDNISGYLIGWYLKQGLFYNINILDTDTNQADKKIQEEFFRKVKDRCNIEQYDEYFSLILTPKT